MWNNVVNAWWPIVFYPATDAPRFHKGMITMICTCVATLGVTWLVWYLERREWRLKAIQKQRDHEERQNELDEKGDGRASDEKSIEK